MAAACWAARWGAAAGWRATARLRRCTRTSLSSTAGGARRACAGRGPVGLGGWGGGWGGRSSVCPCVCVLGGGRLSGRSARQGRLARGRAECCTGRRRPAPCRRPSQPLVFPVLRRHAMIYRGRERRSRRRVVLKAYLRCQRTPVRAEALEREQRMLAAAGVHPGIVVLERVLEVRLSLTPRRRWQRARRGGVHALPPLGGLPRQQQWRPPWVWRCTFLAAWRPPPCSPPAPPAALRTPTRHTWCLRGAGAARSSRPSPAAAAACRSAPPRAALRCRCCALSRTCTGGASCTGARRRARGRRGAARPQQHTRPSRCRARQTRNAAPRRCKGPPRRPPRPWTQ